MKAIFHPYFKEKGEEDLLGYPHAWVGDQYADPIRVLKSTARAHGIEMASSSRQDFRSADAFFFWEYPREGDACFQYSVVSGKPMYLLATEPKTIVPNNYNKEKHTCFDKVFTWQEEMIDGAFYIRIRPITFSRPAVPHSPDFSERKPCVIIASLNLNSSTDPDELYTQRAKTVEWFERNHPDDLDFFGRQNSHTYTDYSIYRGPVREKMEVLPLYKSCICYENNCGMMGYISEKIFDAFFARTVPVYWGAPDVERYIPGNCFIDRRCFSSHEALYKFLAEMSEEQYHRYVENMQNFLESPFAKSYDEYSLAKIILSECFAINL